MQELLLRFVHYLDNKRELQAKKVKIQQNLQLSIHYNEQYVQCEYDGAESVLSWRSKRKTTFQLIYSIKQVSQQ